MNTLSLFFAILTLAIISHQQDVCVLRTSQGIINLSKQAYREPFLAIATYIYDIQLNICAPANGCRNKLAPSILFKYGNVTDCHHSSNTFSKENVSLKLKDEHNPKAGVILTYLNGEIFEDDEGRNLPTETEFDITCDPNVRDDQKPNFRRIFQRNGKNILFLELKSKFVCL